MSGIKERKTKLHLDPLFRVFNHFVTQKLGGNEPLDAVIQSGPHPNGLTWT